MWARIKERFPRATKHADEYGIWLGVWQAMTGAFTYLCSFAPFMQGANTPTWILFWAAVAAGLALLVSLGAIAYALIFKPNGEDISSNAAPQSEIVHEHGIKCADCGHPNIYLSSRMHPDQTADVFLNINTTRSYKQLRVYVTPQLGACGDSFGSNSECHWKKLATVNAFEMADVPEGYSREDRLFKIDDGWLDHGEDRHQYTRCIRFRAVIDCDGSQETDDLVISIVRGPNKFVGYVESIGPDIRHWNPPIKV